MAERLTVKVSGNVSIAHAPAESPNAAAAAQLDMSLGAAEGVGTVRKVVKSAAYVDLGLPAGMLGRFLYLKICCGGQLMVRLTRAQSGAVSLPIPVRTVLLLSFPAGDELTSIEANSGSNDTAIDVEWLAAG